MDLSRDAKARRLVSCFYPTFIFLLLLAFAGPVMAQRGNAPCPDPQEMASAVPSDMSTVQGDIDRLTLCVERANLIQQLNSLIMQREELLNPSTEEEDKTSRANRSTQRQPLPQIRREDLNNVPKIPETAIKQEGQSNNSESGNGVDDWFIVDIRGAGGQLTAQLKKENGQMMMVSTGDKLPSGQTVQNISITDGVEVIIEGDRRNLPWSKG
jgi:hypothetical protein